MIDPKIPEILMATPEGRAWAIAMQKKHPIADTGNAEFDALLEEARGRMGKSKSKAMYTGIHAEGVNVDDFIVYDIDEGEHFCGTVLYVYSSNEESISLLVQKSDWAYRDADDELILLRLERTKSVLICRRPVDE